jgi:hypothetical protein
MKGDEEPEMVIGAILFVLAFGFTLLIIFTRLTNYNTALISNQDTIAAISEAHMAAACLERASSPIDFSKITQKTLDDCSFRGYDICITNEENTAKTWPADCSITNPGHTIYVVVKSGEATFMGRLDVKKS